MPEFDVLLCLSGDEAVSLAGNRGGRRAGAGRKKVERPTNANIAQKVLAQARAEKLWLDLIDLEKKRLGLTAGTDGRGTFSIIPLTNLLRYLEDRAYGRPVDTVNHLHDKPIDMNVNVNMAELVREVRERSEEYERGRNHK